MFTATAPDLAPGQEINVSYRADTVVQDSVSEQVGPNPGKISIVSPISYSQLPVTSQLSGNDTFSQLAVGHIVEYDDSISSGGVDYPLTLSSLIEVGYAPGTPAGTYVLNLTMYDPDDATDPYVDTDYTINLIIEDEVTTPTPTTPTPTTPTPTTPTPTTPTPTTPTPTTPTPTTPTPTTPTPTTPCLLYTSDAADE